MKKKLPHISEVGSGTPAVVFLHSLGGTRAHWHAQLPHVGKSGRAIALDLLGHGDNPTPWIGELTFDRVAKDVITTANHLGLERFILVGHSFGSGAAIACAGMIPEHVAGLLLADPIGDQRQAPQAEMNAFIATLESEKYLPVLEHYWTQILFQATGSTHDRVMNDLMATARDVVVSGLRCLSRFDPVAILRDYAGPTLSVTTPLNDLPYSLHKLIPELPHERIEGTSHWLQMDAPEEFNGMLTRFLEAVDGTAAKGD